MPGLGTAQLRVDGMRKSVASSVCSAGVGSGRCKLALRWTYEAIPVQWLLLVTLLAGVQQRPYTYQLEFASKSDCETAKGQIETAYSARFSTLNFHYSLICIERPPAR
jgi:hypothetical protein